MPSRKASALQKAYQFEYWTTVWLHHLPPGRSRSVFVLGYPKSGTNWCCKLLGSCLDLPVYEFWKQRGPVLAPSVLHLHRFATVPARTVYVVRDGRDIAVSYYFAYVRDLHLGFLPSLEAFCPRPITAEHVRDNLPGFIRYLFERNRVSTIPYDRHVLRAKRLGLFSVRYEDLLSRGETALKSILSFLKEETVPETKIRAALDLHDFESVTGRKHGSEDEKAFVRKGIAGDWRNHFSAEAARTFQQHGGKALIEAGYETDASWTEEFGTR